MKAILNKIFLTLFIIFLAKVSHAQVNGTIAGFVKDLKTQEALTGVSISLEGTTLGAVTDIDGYFKIEKVPTKTYNLKATYVGYKPQIKFDIIVTSGNTLNINFELEEVQEELKEVTVTANPFSKPSETPNSIKSLSSQEIKSYPGGNNDIAKVVQSLPGVSGTLGFRNDVIIRGGAPNENVYYLDGMEIPNINHFATQGSAGGPAGMLNVSFIDDVSLTSSAFGAKYDNPLSGVLQFKQRNGNQDKRQYNLRLGASEFAGTMEGPLIKGNKKITYIASVRRSYLQLLFKLIELPFLPDYWDYQYKVNFKLDEKNDLTVLGLGSIDNFTLNVPDSPSLEQMAILDGIPFQQQKTNTIGFTWKRLVKNGAMYTTLSGNYLDNRAYKYDNNDESTEANLRLRFKSVEYERKLRWELNKYYGKWKVNYSAGVQQAIYRNDNFNRLRAAITNPLNGQIIQPALIFSYKTELNFFKMGAGVQLSRTFLRERLALSAGLRTDVNTFTINGINPLHTLSPRASASYSINEKLSINLSGGRYFKIAPYTVLGFKDSSGSYVNKDSKYIANNHLVAGFEYLLTPVSRITVEGFFKNYTNYPVSNLDSISLANQGGFFGVVGNENVTSIGLGRTYGVEFFFQQRLTKNFYGVFAYTWYHSEFTGFNQQKYIPSSWDNRHLISFTGGYKFGKNWEVGTRFRFLGKAPYTPYDTAASRLNYATTGSGILDTKRFNSLRLDVYNVLDIRIDKKWNFPKWSIDLFIDIQNVYNSVQPSAPNFTLKRNPDNTYATFDGQPFNGTNGIGVILDNATSSSIPTIGLIIEF